MSKNYQPDCGHCPGGFGLTSPLIEDKDFWVVCDVHPLVEGHILIIPREHIVCAGAFSEEIFAKYQDFYQKTKKFVSQSYGSCIVFEHGKIGQTVFHAHTHFLPCECEVSDIVPNTDKLTKIDSLEEIRAEFKKHGQYLFTEINDQKWLVNPDIGFPRFFRDLFAKKLGAVERGNWKTTENNQSIMETFAIEVKNLEKRWKEFHAKI